MFGSHKTRTILVGVLFLCALSAAGFLLNSPGARNALMSIVAPLGRVGVRFSGTMRALVHAGFNFRQQGDENARLTQENQELRTQVILDKETQTENDLLRKQLGEGKQKPHALSLANIVSYDPFHFAQYALIDKGSSDGIAENMPVAMAGNILFGKIFKTYPHFAQVMLIADKNNKVGVQAQDGAVSGVLSGSNGSVLFMDLLEKSASVDAGSVIVTSGLDGVYPKNLTVGTVSEVVSQAEGIFKQAYIAPAYAVAPQTEVFVITDYLR